jgi:F-type H+-transporting ATPase subunit a
VKRWLPIIIILAVLIVPGFVLPRFGADAVVASVAVAPEVIFHIGSFPVSNTLFTTWIVMALLLLFAFAATRKLSMVPSGLQNVFELAVEMWDNLGTSVAGERNKMFFPFVTTIFLFVLFSNFLGLVPGFGPIGIIPVKEGAHAPNGISTWELPFGLGKVLGAHPEAAASATDEHGTAAVKPTPKPGEHATETTTTKTTGATGEQHAEEEVLLAPFVRSPSTDMNTTLALAVIAMFMTQLFGMKVVGPIKYWTKFFNFAKVGEFFGSLAKGKPQFGLLFYGFIDLFVGILELISEMVKVLSFTFRLFGNIFAGEVVLLIMSFLFFALPFPFYALELFVGFMQAFVFGILTLVFMTIATTAHGAEEHH